MLEKSKAGSTSLIVVLAATALLMAGCQNVPATQDIPRDPFTTTWSLGEEDRTLSISGDSAGHRAGETSEFLLTLDNVSGDGPWQGEYCIVLVDREGVLKEISSDQYNVRVGVTTQESIVVEFPEDFEGPLGLCVVVPECLSVVTTLWVGTSQTGSAGPWPNIMACP